MFRRFRWAAIISVIVSVTPTFCSAFPASGASPFPPNRSDIDIEGVQYGIVITASNAPGYKFTNVSLEGRAGGTSGVLAVGLGGRCT